MLLALASFMLTSSWGACAASVEGQHKDGTGLQSCLAPAPLNCLLTFFFIPSTVVEFCVAFSTSY